jgi:hypothetical protein
MAECSRDDHELIDQIMSPFTLNLNQIQTRRVGYRIVYRVNDYILQQIRKPETHLKTHVMYKSLNVSEIADNLRYFLGIVAASACGQPLLSNEKMDQICNEVLEEIRGEKLSEPPTKRTKTS